jgi:L-amino acid N-acyltransferase YncA
MKIFEAVTPQEIAWARTQFGFEHAGTIRHAGSKFGRWLDLEFYQLILETPAEPVDG